MHGSRVQAKTLTSTGALVAQRAAVHGVYYVGGASAGAVVIRDGGASGTIILDIKTPASATWTHYVKVPKDGVLALKDVHVTLTNATSATVFYST